MEHHNQSRIAVMVYLLHTKKGKKIDDLIQEVHDDALSKIRKVRQEVVVLKTIAPSIFDEVRQKAVRRLYEIFKRTAEALKKIYDDFCLLHQCIVVPTITDVVLLIDQWCGVIPKPMVFSAN